MARAPKLATLYFRRYIMANIKIYNQADIQKQIDDLKKNSKNSQLVVIKDYKALELRVLNLELNIAYIQDKFSSYFPKG